MLANAMTEEFEHIELFGKPVLFTTARVEKATVPKGWYRYEIRGSDYDPEEFCTIEPRVIVNHAGTILSPEEIPLQDSESRRYIRGQENFLDEYMTLAEFCACHDLPIPENPQKYLVRPASPEEAGLFYAQTPEQDEALGAIGHVRIDFGHGGKEFWHTWHPRGAEELNSPEFKAELDEVVGQLRESVLQDLSSMRGYCHQHGGEIEGGICTQNYGYTVETERYRYFLRCNPIEGDHQAYLSCFDKQAQKLSKEETLVDRASFASGDQMQGTTDLKITDYFGDPVTLRPRIELYSVIDFMGMELPGLAIVLDKVGDSPIDLEQYAFLTVSFGEHISIKNSAYIDTNNCPFAEQLLEQGIAEPTGLYKTSGYCRYPLWVFKEEFLQTVGGENYQEYAKIYDQYMNPSDDKEQKELPIGRVSFASGEQIEYTNPAEYLKAIREELPYHATTGFRFETLTSDPEVRKAADDALYDLYGEENPRPLEDYQEQSEQGMTMGGM